MAYSLGIDVGMTCTSVAIYKSGEVEFGQSIPSVIFIDADHTVVGEPALVRAASEPARVASEFKRRVGDEIPLYISGHKYTAEQLMGLMIREAVSRVTTSEHEPPERITVTHPATWGDDKLEKFKQAVEKTLPRPCPLILMSEPEAAAVYYASTHQLNQDDTFAVYDLGGNTFNVAVMRRSSTGWETLGTGGIEYLGGVDFDQAIWSYLDETTDHQLSSQDPTNGASTNALQQLKLSCVTTKETLSRDSSADIPVNMPNYQSTVRLTRPEFETRIKSHIQNSADTLKRVVADAHVTVDQLRAVLLVGGSSRIPLVSELVSETMHDQTPSDRAEINIPVPVVVDTDPGQPVALGAALAAGKGRLEAVSPAGQGTPEPAASELAPGEPPDDTHQRQPMPQRRRVLIAVAAAAATVLIVGLAVVISIGRNAADHTTQAASQTQTSSPTAPASVLTSAPASPSPTTVPSPTPSPTASPSSPSFPSPTLNSTAIPPSTLDSSTIAWMAIVCQAAHDIDDLKVIPGTTYPNIAAARADYVNVYARKASIAETAAATLESRLPVTLAEGRLDPDAAVNSFDALTEVFQQGSTNFQNLKPTTVRDFDELAKEINRQADVIGLAADVNQLSVEEIEYLGTLPGCERLG